MLSNIFVIFGLDLKKKGDGAVFMVKPLLHFCFTIVVIAIIIHFIIIIVTAIIIVMMAVRAKKE